MFLNDPFAELDIGLDVEDGDHVVVARARSGGPDNQHIFMPLSMKKKLSEDERLIMGEMQRAVLLINKIQSQIDEAVADGRAAGMSWAAIGWSVGLTAEGARQKWMNPDD